MRDPNYKKNLKRFYGEPSAHTVSKSSHRGFPLSAAMKLDQFVTKA
jgi:hypothetical protein